MPVFESKCRTRSRRLDLPEDLDALRRMGVSVGEVGPSDAST